MPKKNSLDFKNNIHHIFVGILVKPRESKMCGGGGAKKEHCFQRETKEEQVTYICGSVEKKQGKTQSEACVKGENLVELVHSYTRLGVFTDPFFKEVCFPLEADRFHPLKRVVNVVLFPVSEGNQ